MATLANNVKWNLIPPLYSSISCVNDKDNGCCDHGVPHAVIGGTKGIGHYLMIFCFSSENSKFEVRAGGSLPLSIIVKMICKMYKDLNQYKIPVYRDPPLMCNLTNKALAKYLFKLLASCLKILENVNLERTAPMGNQSTGAIRSR